MAITITLFINWILRPAVNNIPPIIQQNTIAVPKSSYANNNPIKGNAYITTGTISFKLFNLPFLDSTIFA